MLRCLVMTVNNEDTLLGCFVGAGAAVACTVFQRCKRCRIESNLSRRFSIHSVNSVVWSPPWGQTTESPNSLLIERSVIKPFSKSIVNLAHFSPSVFAARRAAARSTKPYPITGGGPSEETILRPLVICAVIFSCSFYEWD